MARNAVETDVFQDCVFLVIQNMSSQGLTHMTLKNFMKSTLKMKHHFSSLPFKYFVLLSSITVSFSID